MHIPDGYLSPSTCVVMDLIMLPIWYKAIKTMRKDFTPERVPKLAMAAAFSFLVMMFNVPIPDGTTAHAIGATLAAILFGPWAAVISMSIALAIQAVVFGDGGILAFGANCFNMGFVAPMVGFYVYKLIGGFSSQPKSGGQMWRAAVAAYVGIVCAAAVCGIELGLQPMLFHTANGAALYAPFPITVSVPAMILPHATLIGFVEAVVTALVLRFAEGPLRIESYQELHKGV